MLKDQDRQAIETEKLFRVQSQEILLRLLVESLRQRDFRMIAQDDKSIPLIIDIEYILKTGKESIFGETPDHDLVFAQLSAAEREQYATEIAEYKAWREDYIKSKYARAEKSIEDRKSTEMQVNELRAQGFQQVVVLAQTFDAPTGRPQSSVHRLNVFYDLPSEQAAACELEIRQHIQQVTEPGTGVSAIHIYHKSKSVDGKIDSENEFKVVYYSVN